MKIKKNINNNISLKKDLNKSHLININDINYIDTCFIKDNNNKKAKRLVTILHKHDNSAEKFKNIFITYGEEHCDNKDFEKIIIKLCLKHCDYNILEFSCGSIEITKYITNIVINNNYIRLEIYQLDNKSYAIDMWKCNFDKKKYEHMRCIKIHKDELPIQYIKYNIDKGGD